MNNGTDTRFRKLNWINGKKQANLFDQDLARDFIIEQNLDLKTHFGKFTLKTSCLLPL
jgi:hypothetical protein